MKNFIAVREGTDKPLLLPADITLITEACSSFSQKRPEDLQVILATRKTSQSLIANAQQWDISGDAISQALRANGTTMIEMPFVWGDETIGRHFVDPAALTYITTSVAKQRAGDTERTAAILMGLKGGGFVESGAVPARIIQDIVNAAYAANPALRIVEPRTASSRFYEPGFTIFDPADVVRVYENGSQVNVLYRDGYCSDYMMPRIDYNNRHLNNLFDRIVRMRGGDAAAEKATFTDKPLMNRVRNHTDAYAKRKETAVRRDFARAVAATCPDLYEFKDATQFFYTSLKNIGVVVQKDKDLFVDYLRDTPDGKGMHGGGRTVSFRDEAAARVALKALTQQIR